MREYGKKEGESLEFRVALFCAILLILGGLIFGIVKTAKKQQPNSRKTGWHRSFQFAEVTAAGFNVPTPVPGCILV